LLTKTEDFSDAVWYTQANGVNLTTGQNNPYGNPLATLMTVNASGLIDNHIRTTTTQSVSSTYTQSMYAKAGTANYIILYNIAAVAGSSLTWFNLATGVVGTTGAGITANMQSMGSGWYRCTITGKTGSTIANNLIDYKVANADNNTNTLAGDSIYIWGADLRPTNAGTLLPPYQRVNTASDYDSVGFPLYLKCNGTSSAMATNSIDFTSTDKMTVVTGVRKLYNGVGGTDLGILMELSAFANFNNGAFSLIPQGTSLYSITLDLLYKASSTANDNLTNSALYLAPVPLVLSGKLDFSAPSNLLRANGSQAALSTTSVGSGNFGNYPVYLFARAGTSLWFNGNFYGAIIRGAQSDIASVVQTENYMAQKTGITF
jgi:hypothetical protein